MKKKKSLLVGGSSKWGKTIYKNIKNKVDIEYIYSKYATQNKISKISKSVINKVDLFFLTSNFKKNHSIMQMIKKEDKNKKIFIEKPFVYKINQLNKVKKYKNIFVNHQHIYAEPIVYLQKILKRKEFKKLHINIIFGNNLKKIQNQYLEWLPHVFSILYKLFGKKIKNINFRKKVKAYKKNVILINLQNFENNLNIVVGNNLKSKTYILQIKTTSNLYNYDGLKPKNLEIFNLKTKKKITKEFKKMPVENSIDEFLKDKEHTFKNNYQIALYSMLSVFKNIP